MPKKSTYVYEIQPFCWAFLRFMWIISRPLRTFQFDTDSQEPLLILSKH